MYDKNISLRTKPASFIILALIPLTIYIGINFLQDRRYIFISMLIIFQIMIPFFMVFEDRKPDTRELILIASLVAIGAVSRAAFFWLPQFKPMMAITIITAISLGSESGFLTGALIAFISNFLFGQGPWTPWQMFATGIIGYLSGLLYRLNLLSSKKIPLSIYGFFTIILIYGPIMDFSSVITSNTVLNIKSILIYMISGLSFNVIYGVSTALFLYLFSQIFIEKLTRIKIKYGFLDRKN